VLSAVEIPVPAEEGTVGAYPESQSPSSAGHILGRRSVTRQTLGIVLVGLGAYPPDSVPSGNVPGTVQA
jgi:hypothetical protein